MNPRRPACLALLLVASAAAAQEIPIVAIEATPGTISVGEPVQLRVTVLGPTWFPRPPVFPSFELANAVTRLPPDSSFPTTARVAGQTWSGVYRDYRIYPLVGATYRLDDLTMTVTYADPNDRSPVAVDIAVPPIEFRAQVPAGAEKLNPYIAGRELTLRRELQGGTDSLAVGDALVARYVAELDGLPAIFLPTLVKPGETPGVSVYADQPEVEDGMPARRTEKLTYVFDAGGDFEIPATALDWWNTQTSTVETASVPALTISVAGPAPSSGSADEPTAERNWWPVAGGALVLLAGLRFLFRQTAAVSARWLAYRMRRQASEQYAFDRLRKTVGSGDPHAAHSALTRWLARLEPTVNARQFARTYGDAELGEQIEKLSLTLYSGATAPVDLKRLEACLVPARRRYEHASANRAHALLPPLNP